MEQTGIQLYMVAGAPDCPAGRKSPRRIPASSPSITREQTARLPVSAGNRSRGRDELWPFVISLWCSSQRHRATGWAATTVPHQSQSSPQARVPSSPPAQHPWLPSPPLAQTLKAHPRSPPAISRRLQQGNSLCAQPRVKENKVTFQHSTGAPCPCTVSTKHLAQGSTGQNRARQQPRVWCLQWTPLN